MVVFRLYAKGEHKSHYLCKYQEKLTSVTFELYKFVSYGGFFVAQKTIFGRWTEITRQPGKYILLSSDFCASIQSFVRNFVRYYKKAGKLMQDYSINELIEKISADTIIIPKSVAFRKDVYEESKTLFGVVFTECVNDLRSYGSFIDGKTVGKMMKDYVMDMTIPDIQCECLCSPTMASAARSETVMLINKTNLLECLRESQVI